MNFDYVRTSYIIYVPKNIFVKVGLACCRGAACLAACKANPATRVAVDLALALAPEIPTPNAKELYLLKEMSIFYSLFSRIPAPQSTGFEQLNLPITPTQQYQIFRTLNANDVAAMGGTQQHIQQALAEGRAYGIALCSDSRCPAPLQIPQAKQFVVTFPAYHNQVRLLMRYSVQIEMAPILLNPVP